MRRPPNLTPAAKQTTPEPEPAAPSSYLDLYGLSKPPFGGLTDNAGYILFGSHRRVFERLVDHLVNGTGVMVLHGDEGTGKTEMLKALATVASESGLRTQILARPPNGRVTLASLTAAMTGKPAGTEAATAAFLAPPRKALLVDDFDLLPPDCTDAIAALASKLTDQPGGSAIVLAVTGLPPMPAVRDTLRLSHLGPAEVRQYIERSLWLAGGTTRRLITADAMKLLIAQSTGAPSRINRLMEAAFTAGFARGDAMINARTITAAMGPTAVRRPPRDMQWPAMAGQAAQAVSVGLLVIGAAVFLYRGLAEPEPPAPPARTQAVEKAPPAEKPPARMAPDLVAALLKRGDESLKLGDIAAARLLFQRAADGGSAQAADRLRRLDHP